MVVVRHRLPAALGSATAARPSVASEPTPKKPSESSPPPAPIANNSSPGVARESADTFVAGDRHRDAGAIVGTPRHGPRQTTSLVVRVGKAGVVEIPALPDGGYLVNAETGTTTHWGPAAANLLRRTKVFDRETEIIVEPGVRVSVATDGGDFTLAEPGVLLLSPGTRARVRVETGDALVVQNERPPRWYTRTGADGPHADHFNSLVAFNRYLATGRLARRDAFPDGVVDLLLRQGLVVADQELVGVAGAASVRWADACSESALNSALKGAVSDTAVEATVGLWQRAQIRAAVRDHGGRVLNSRFAPAELKTLLAVGLLIPDARRANASCWAEMFTERDVADRLAKTALDDDSRSRILEAWRRTTASGYDLTGLVYRHEGVAAFAWRGRSNMWNEQPSEWVVSSDTRVEGSEPFVVGASEVIAPGRLVEPVPFRTLRPAESLHCHPVFGLEAMTECYMVQRGRGALLTVIDGKAVVHLLGPGDIAVVEAGVDHMAVAAAGEYQHAVFQVPSTFQYGLRFKQTRNADEIDIDIEQATKAALLALAKGARGELAVEGAPRVQT
jgi:hypothetical protein